MVVMEVSDGRVMRRALWVALYAIAMAAVESAVVVYLRALDGGAEPLSVLLHEIPDRLVAIEVGREVATLVMLVAVAALAARNVWERLLYLALAFGVWDIFYYVWLWVFIRWPPSLLTWDVLFLIPVPWIGPVLAPVLISLMLVAGSLLLLRLKAQGVMLGFSSTVWSLAVAGGFLVLGSFMLDFASVLRQMAP